MSATVPAAGLAQDAYEATAPVYDAFTVYHRYELWTDMLERLLRPHGLPRRGRLFDVGCGTGKSFQPWEARGWSVVGCDASPAMLVRAAAKAAPGTATLVADARELPDLGAFDLVTMTDDVANYLTPAEQEAAFEGARRNLAPGGLLVFDLNTLLTFRTYFTQVDVRDAEDCYVVLRGHASADFMPGDTAEATMDAFVRGPGGRWERRLARHRQHHHPIEGVAERLRDAGLTVCSVHGTDDDCNTGPLDELAHAKAIVVAARDEG